MTILRSAFVTVNCNHMDLKNNTLYFRIFQWLSHGMEKFLLKMFPKSLLMVQALAGRIGAARHIW